MSEISGIDNELEFVKYLNGKRVSDLNPMFRDLIEDLFSNVNEYLMIKCWSNYRKQKSDIFIRIDGLTKGISIKKGMKNSVHVEGISSFIHFLIENKVERDVVIEYLKYHYADGSTNGMGIERLSVLEYKEKNQLSIDKINEIFNEEKLLSAAIDRFVIKGRNADYYISAIIWGEVNDFLWLKTGEVKNIILSKKDLYSTAVHFGPMTV